MYAFQFQLVTRAARSLVWCLGIFFLVVAISGGAASAARAAEPGPDQQSFAIAGTTTRPLLADALVEVRVGTTLFTGVTDAAGQFTVQVSCAGSTDDLVYVIITGAAGQSELQLARVLDGCARVQAIAAQDGRYRTGPVNPISTGMYAAMRWYAEREDGTSWPMSAPELLQVQYLLGGGWVATAARAIIYWEAGLGTPPAGFDTVLDLLRDRVALSDYVGRVRLDESAARLREIALAVFWDPAHFRQPSTLASNTGSATVCAELQQICGEFFDFHPSGSLQFVDRFNAASGQWLDLARQDQIFSDALERRFSTLRTLEAMAEPDEFLWVSESPTLIFRPDLGLVSTIRRTAATRARVRIVEASDLIPLLSVQYDTIQDFPEFPDIEPIETRDAVPGLHSGLLDLSQRPLWAGPQAGEQWVLPLLLPDVVSEFSPVTTVRVQFQTGADAVLVDGERALEWSFADQVLSLSSEELGQQRLYFLGQAAGRHPVFFVDAAPGAPASRRIETAAGFQPTAAAGGWQADQVAGRYVGGFAFDSWLSSSAPVLDQYFVFDLNADGSGRVGEVPTPDAPLHAGDELSWSIDEQAGLIIRRELSPDFRQWRRWERLNEVQGSGDLYVRESRPLFLERAIDDPPEFLDYRVNFYRLGPIPE
ncbi:MAG: hypothetical protein ACXIUM_11790 [Wenzhouxiangella sp.]